MNLLKCLIIGLCLLEIGTSHAVYVNDDGTGEVLIYPYYTINNNQNTLYSIINTTADTKAIKIRFREGENGTEVLDFNVYLSAFDVWTGSLAPAVSTYTGHVGEPTAVHISNDTSCAPFLIKSGQEFLPFLIDLDFDNNSMQRSTEGYIEVYEMSTFFGPTIPAADHGSNGTPSDCDFIRFDWQDNGTYDTADEGEPTGGIFGQATLLDVSNGNMISYDATALDYFWQGFGQHSEPGSLFPTLNIATPESLRMVNGNALKSNWINGVDAVSAALMQHKLYNEYELYAIVAANTEWVVTFPTKHLLVNNSFGPQAPFTQSWNGNQACEASWFSTWDSNEVNEAAAELDFCYSVNVLEFLLPGSPSDSTSALLGSFNSIPVNTPNQPFASENGWAEISFNEGGQTLNSTENNLYYGLPVTGFAVKRFINAGAGEGLLAIYASSMTHKSQPQITLTDLIFMDGFEGN